MSDANHWRTLIDATADAYKQSCDDQRIDAAISDLLAERVALIITAHQEE